MDNGPVGTVKRLLARAADIIGVVERYFTAILTIVMTALYALNVLVRLFFPLYASDFAWIDEASRYIMIWVVFLAAGIALEVGRHITVDIAYGLLSKAIVHALFRIIDVVGLAFSLIAAYFSFNLAMFVAGTGQVSPTLGVPTYILYVAPFLGFLLLAFRYLLRLIDVRDSRRWPVEANWLKGGAQL